MCCLINQQKSGNFPGGGAFEQLFGPVRGEFEQKFSKNSNARGLPGRMLKLRFDCYITSLDWEASTASFWVSRLITLLDLDGFFSALVNSLASPARYHVCARFVTWKDIILFRRTFIVHTYKGFSNHALITEEGQPWKNIDFRFFSYFVHNPFILNNIILKIDNSIGIWNLLVEFCLDTGY